MQTTSSLPSPHDVQHDEQSTCYIQTPTPHIPPPSHQTILNILPHFPIFPIYRRDLTLSISSKPHPIPFSHLFPFSLSSSLHSSYLLLPTILFSRFPHHSFPPITSFFLFSAPPFSHHHTQPSSHVQCNSHNLLRPCTSAYMPIDILTSSFSNNTPHRSTLFRTRTSTTIYMYKRIYKKHHQNKMLF